MSEKTNITKALNSILSLPDQAQDAWEESSKVDFPDSYKGAQNVVISGMGGSGLPGHILASVFATKVPFKSINSYDLPYWVGSNTLVVLSSYSGNTEETLSCAREALKSNSKITGITTGGRLGDFLKKNKFPGFIYTPSFNPSLQPRFGLGYSLFGLLGLLNKLAFLVSPGGTVEYQVSSSIKSLAQEKKRLSKEAGLFAKVLKNRVPVIFGADHLVGSAHAFQNQLNETAKTFAVYYSIPESNHHLLEGLKNAEIVGRLAAVFLISENYSPSIAKRFELTKEIFEKNGIPTSTYKAVSKSLLPQVFEVLYFSSLVSFYLSQEYNQDPIAIPSVDYSKAKLS